MSSLDTTHVDLECGRGGRPFAGGEESDDESVCFSDADGGSCYSQFYSTADGSYDDYATDLEAGGGLDSRRASSAAQSDYSVEIGNRKMSAEREQLGEGGGMMERDCRICHMSLLSANAESGIAIELGCSCKDDLAAAHKNCAETWFKIKGNKTCEICNSVARNISGANETESPESANETTLTVANIVSTPVPPTTTAEARNRLNGHRFVNFLLACMVIAFVISWLFHFNIPS